MKAFGAKYQVLWSEIILFIACEVFKECKKTAVTVPGVFYLWHIPRLCAEETFPAKWMGLFLVTSQFTVVVIQQRNWHEWSGKRSYYSKRNGRKSNVILLALVKFSKLQICINDGFLGFYPCSVMCFPALRRSMQPSSLGLLNHLPEPHVHHVTWCKHPAYHHLNNCRHEKQKI